MESNFEKELEFIIYIIALQALMTFFVHSMLIEHFVDHFLVFGQFGHLWIFSCAHCERAILWNLSHVGHVCWEMLAGSFSFEKMQTITKIDQPNYQATCSYKRVLCIELHHNWMK